MADTRDLETRAKEMAEYYLGKRMSACEISNCVARVKQEHPPLYKLLVAELREIKKAK